jgi:hypothetical protein
VSLTLRCFKLGGDPVEDVVNIFVKVPVGFIYRRLFFLLLRRYGSCISCLFCLLVVVLLVLLPLIFFFL